MGCQLTGTRPSDRSFSWSALTLWRMHLLRAGVSGAVALVFMTTVASAQPPTLASPDGRKQVRAVRTDGPITVDGILDEAVWAQAPAAADFIQADPSEGQPATEATEVRIAFDEENLYIAAVCRDSQPSAIVVNDIRKDFADREQDTFEVLLDTFADRRNGFVFVTNAKAQGPTRRWRARGAKSIPTGMRCGG